MEKLVSVIVPTFQRGQIIDRALKSIFAQRAIGDWAIEAIVIDDGSSDETEAVVKGMSAPSPHRIIYQKIEHVGKPGLVRNVGLELAKGELIGYCDSDDIWLPHHLATCLRQFELHPDIVMVETWWSFQQLSRGLRRWQIAFASLPTDGRTTTTNSRVHRRSVLPKVGHFSDLAWGEDIDLWTRIGFAGPIRRVKIPTTVHSYTREGNNVTFAFCPDIASRYNGRPTALPSPAPAAEQAAPIPPPPDPPLSRNRRWRRRIAYAIEHPGAAGLLVARRTLPEHLRQHPWLRQIRKRLIGP